MSAQPGAVPGREQRLVFGEVAELYDRERPGYPEALIDAVLEIGGLHAGDRALEIGAGTGKATMPFVARGVDVCAIEPSAEMGSVLRSKGVPVITTSFEDWPVEPGAFRLLYAAQSWHWVAREHRYALAARALTPGGVLALFWNLPQEFDGALGADIDAAYREHAPHLSDMGTDKWDLDVTLTEIDESSAFEKAGKQIFVWTQGYSSAQYVALMGTHSDHRLLAGDQRARLHRAVGEVVDNHGGQVEVTYHTELYFSRRS